MAGRLAAVGAGLAMMAAGGSASNELETNASVVGYYSWNWGTGSRVDNATMSIAFTGYSNVGEAINAYDVDASWCCPDLSGERYLALGGGNSAGRFWPDVVKNITSSLGDVVEAGYDGVVFDIELVHGNASVMVPLFAASFAEAKRLGLKVIVTMSHSAPYRTDTPTDAVDLVKSWVHDSNIDIISPQLYSSGHELAPELAETFSCKSAGCNWLLFVGTKAKFVPSIVDATHFPATKNFFDEAMHVEGFIVWAQFVPGASSAAMTQE